MLMICPHGRTHFGMDAEIQAMDGNWTATQVLDLSKKRRHSGRDCRDPENMDGDMLDQEE